MLSYNPAQGAIVGPIEVDVGARLVRRDGMDVHLAPKAFDLLLILVRNQPNAVSHADLHATLWPGIHVSETSLAALVTQLRKALGDTADGALVIRTLHRVGYAFIGDAVVHDPALVAVVPRCRVIWRGESIDVTAGEAVIGRDRGCAVYLDADSISRHHARLHVTSDAVKIEDLGSKNGTWLDGERIRGAVPLADGTTVRLGSESVRFELISDDRPTKTAIVP